MPMSEIRISRDPYLQGRIEAERQRRGDPHLTHTVKALLLERMAEIDMQRHGAERQKGQHIDRTA